MNANKYKKAEEYIKEALKINKTKEILIAYGKIYLKKNEIDNAIQKFEEAYNIASNDINLMSTLGNLYLKTKEKAKAIKYYNKVLNVEKKYSKISNVAILKY